MVSSFCIYAKISKINNKNKENLYEKFYNWKYKC